MAVVKHNNSGKFKLFSHFKYEHLVAGVSGGVTSTLLLHPLDLIKIRFAGEFFQLFYFIDILKPSDAKRGVNWGDKAVFFS